MRYTISFLGEQYDQLSSHLFNTLPLAEQAAYLHCGISRTLNEARLLVRRVTPVRPEHLLSQSMLHMSISSQSFLPAMKEAHLGRECLAFVHSHPTGVPGHSLQDDREEEHLFRTAHNRIATANAIHASLVLSSPENPVARVWLDGGS